MTSLQFSEKTLTGMRKLDNLFGSDNIMEKVLGLDFLISPRAYFCINTAGAEVLVQTLRDGGAPQEHDAARHLLRLWRHWAQPRQQRQCKS